MQYIFTVVAVVFELSNTPSRGTVSIYMHLMARSKLGPYRKSRKADQSHAEVIYRVPLYFEEDKNAGK